jgi:hypothetical protein
MADRDGPLRAGRQLNKDWAENSVWLASAKD